MYVLKVKLALSAQSDLIVAIAAIYWSTFVGLKRHLGVFATLGTYCREHLALGPVAIISIAIATIAILPCLPFLAA